MKRFWKKLKEKIIPKGITAVGIYSMTKYGSILTAEGIKIKVIHDIDTMIQNRVSHNVFSTVIDLDTEDKDLINFVIKYYESKGFTCELITSNTHAMIDSPKLYIGWKTVKII
jgi:hypothetical protein